MSLYQRLKIAKAYRDQIFQIKTYVQLHHVRKSSWLILDKLVIYLSEQLFLFQETEYTRNPEIQFCIFRKIE